VEAKAIAKNLRSTPRKACLVADEVRGKFVSEALTLLEYGIQKKVAGDISKLIKSAVANLENKNPEAVVDLDNLKIKEIIVYDGPTLKRFRARAQGRAGKIIKRLCHISVVVAH